MASADSVTKAVTDQEAPSLGDFEATYSAHFGFVWRCLRGLGVPQASLDDAVQEVFLVVHRRGTEFRGGSLRSWIYAIVRNVAANQRRSQRRRPTNLPLDVEPASETPGPHEELAARESAAFVQTFLQSLDDPQRELFVLALLEGVPTPEIAEALHIPLNTTYTRLRSLRHAFARALAREQERQRFRP